MTDTEAVEELAAALNHLYRGVNVADSEEVEEILLSSLDSLDETASEVLAEIGEQHRNRDD